MKYKQTTFDRILKGNKFEISNYLLSHIDGSRNSPTKDDKIELDCPYCADSKRKRFKMMINLDWGGRVKCYRCGKSVSIFTLAKKLGFYNDFVTLAYFFELCRKHNRASRPIAVFAVKRSVSGEKYLPGSLFRVIGSVCDGIVRGM